MPERGISRSARPECRFGRFVEEARERDQLVVQPRMGFSRPEAMRAGLHATREAEACTVGTITLDSFTRVGDHGSARRALQAGQKLNGFPVVAHGAAITDAVLEGVQGDDFPVQVRHGTALPDAVIAVLVETGVEATEGGPISYSMPYGRTPLEASVASWERCSRVLALQRGRGVEWHVETFGGCMLGQLCPPELLVAISMLEAIFFVRNGIGSVSLSYAQQTNLEQDLEALAALRMLAERFLAGVDWHVVLYTWMGLYPRTVTGASRLLLESAALARKGGAERLIVKTAAEAHQIPTIAENVSALEAAATASRVESPVAQPRATATSEAAACLVEAVLNASEKIGEALCRSFAGGLLDVPYCLHPDNRNRSRSYVDGTGWLRWSHPGEMPLEATKSLGQPTDPSAAELLAMLSYNRRKYDSAQPPPCSP